MFDRENGRDAEYDDMSILMPLSIDVRFTNRLPSSREVNVDDDVDMTDNGGLWLATAIGRKNNSSSLRADSLVSFESSVGSLSMLLVFSLYN